jgi:(E)-2-((N-methylformamido)methylene)succinate hydrolase
MVMTKTAKNGSRFDMTGPQDGDVVVLIHGLGLNRQIWKDYVPELSAHYRLLNYDLFGHGESAPPPGKPDLRTYSEQLLGLLDELDISRAALVGFSLGGMINRRMAIDYRERVSALAILNSPHERAPEAQKLVEERAFDTAQGGPGATLDATIERWFTAEFIRSNPGYIQQVRNWVLANDATLYAQCRQVLATGVTELINPTPPIIHPTLVVTCENDSGSTPAMSHGIAREILSSQTLIVPQLQHMGLVEQPELFVQPLVTFLKQTLRSA